MGCVAQDFGAAEVPGDFCRNLTDFIEAKAPSLRESAEPSSSSTGSAQLFAFLISLELDLLGGKRGQLGNLSHNKANPLTNRAERKWRFFLDLLQDPRLVLPLGFAYNHSITESSLRTQSSHLVLSTANFLQYFSG